MKPMIALSALLIAALALPAGGPAGAADLAVKYRPAYSHHLPFARSARAQAVWGEGACWSACQSSCTWGLNACLRVDSQGRCLEHTDACDRACQRDCRTRGGPLADTFE